LWDEGQHVAAQHRNRAIVAYGLRPRTRPVHSYKLSVRMLDVSEGAEIWVGDRAVDALPAVIEPGEPIAIAEGGVYIALIPLEPSDMGSGAPIELNVVNGTLTLDLYNYRGPDKTFWEHRSQSGPFYKGNTRSAFVLEVGDRSEFEDIAAFRRHIAAARITDSVDDEYMREIAYASGDSSIAMRYSLWDMSLIERRFDGMTYSPPMGRAGALDGSGVQWLHSRDSMVELGGVTLMAGRAPKWLAVDRESRRYVVVNPSDESVPVWLETPAGTVVECDEFGFGRIDLDERELRVAIEANGEIGVLRIRSEGAPRLMVNGTDVTDALTGPDDAGTRTFRGVS
jgi:hypothetical protein